MKILVSKQVSLFDEDVNIALSELPVGSTVRIVLTCLHNAATYESWARFKVGPDGKVDFSRDAPLEGRYWGIDQMGLFSSMCLTSNIRLGSVMAFYNAEDVLLPYQLTVYARKEILGQTTILKRILDPSVQRIEVNEGQLRGVLFKPRGTGVHRAVIDMCGLGGRCKEHRAALLAQKGFAVLALALYDYEDRPKSPNDVDLSYVKEAIDWITSQSFTSDKCVLLGQSFGGYVSYLAALRCPKVASVISISAPTFTGSGITILENGRRAANIFELTPQQESHRKFIRNEVINVSMWDHIFDHEPEVIAPYFLPMERAPAEISFMLVAGEKDAAMPAVRWSRLLEKRLRSSPKRRVDTVYLKHSGHMIEPPHMPQHNTLYIPPAFWAQGGDQYLQCVDQRELWPKIHEFIRTTVALGGEKAKI